MQKRVILLIAAAVFVSLGFFSHLVGIATTEWSVLKTILYRRTWWTGTYHGYGYDGGDVTVGLFSHCFRYFCRDNKYELVIFSENPHEPLDSRLGPVQFMAAVSLLLALVAIVLIGLQLFLVLKKKAGLKAMPIIAGILSISACVLLILGIIIYLISVHGGFNGFYVDSSIGYSLVLSFLGAILFLIGGILLFIKQPYRVGPRDQDGVR